MYKRATRYPSIRPSIHADRHPSVALTLLLLPRYQEGRTAFWVATYADNHQALSALLRFSTSIKPSDKVCLTSAFCPQPPSLIRCVCGRTAPPDRVAGMGHCARPPDGRQPRDL